MTPPAARDTGRARGSALISAVVLLVLVGIVGIILLQSTRIDVTTSIRGVRAQEAFYLAVAGLETGRDQLRLSHAASAPAVGLGAELAAAAGPNGAIDFSPDRVQVVHDAMGRPIGLCGYGDDVPLRPFTVLADGAYAAFVTNDPGDGPTTLADSNGRVLLTAVGVGREQSFEKAQALVSASEGFAMRELERRQH